MPEVMEERHAETNQQYVNRLLTHIDQLQSDLQQVSEELAALRVEEKYLRREVASWRGSGPGLF